MSKKVFLTFCFLSLLINILISPLAFEYRFYIIGILNLVLSYYLLLKNPFKFYGWVFIFITTIIFNILAIMFLINTNKGFLGMQLVLIYNISSLFSILIYKLRIKKTLSIIYILLYLTMCVNFKNINNYYFSKLYENEIVGINLPDIIIKDIKGNVKNINKTNKVLLIDLWSNSCSYCIQSFPKFEEVFKHYKNDSEVEVISINVDEANPNRMRGFKYVKKYSFNNYFTSNEILKKLKFNKFPNYMIVGKDGKIKYFGSLNTHEMETYNNIYELIENEK